MKLKQKNFEINVEIYFEEDEPNQTYVYISDNSSGCKYKVSTTEEVAAHVKDYIENLIEYSED